MGRDIVIDADREKLFSMIYLLGEIRKPCMDRITAGKGKSLHIAAIGVFPDYEGRGIATI